MVPHVATPLVPMGDSFRVRGRPVPQRRARHRQVPVVPHGHDPGSVRPTRQLARSPVARVSSRLPRAILRARSPGVLGTVSRPVSPPHNARPPHNPRKWLRTCGGTQRAVHAEEIPQVTRSRAREIARNSGTIRDAGAVGDSRSLAQSRSFDDAGARPGAGNTGNARPRGGSGPDDLTGQRCRLSAETRQARTSGPRDVRKLVVGTGARKRGCRSGVCAGKRADPRKRGRSGAGPRCGTRSSGPRRGFEARSRIDHGGLC